MTRQQIVTKFCVVQSIPITMGSPVLVAQSVVQTSNKIVTWGNIEKVLSQASESILVQAPWGICLSFGDREALTGFHSPSPAC